MLQNKDILLYKPGSADISQRKLFETINKNNLIGILFTDIKLYFLKVHMSLYVLFFFC